MGLDGKEVKLYIFPASTLYRRSRPITNWRRNDAWGKENSSKRLNANKFLQHNFCPLFNDITLLHVKNWCWTNSARPTSLKSISYEKYKFKVYHWKLNFLVATGNKFEFFNTDIPLGQANQSGSPNNALSLPIRINVTNLSIQSCNWLSYLFIYLFIHLRVLWCNFYLFFSVIL